MTTFVHLQDHNRGVYQDVRDAFQNKSHEAQWLLKIKARLRLCIFQNKSQKRQHYFKTLLFLFNNIHKFHKTFSGKIA